jgi:hypothetical protein
LWRSHSTSGSGAFHPNSKVGTDPVVAADEISLKFLQHFQNIYLSHAWFVHFSSFGDKSHPSAFVADHVLGLPGLCLAIGTARYEKQESSTVPSPPVDIYGPLGITEFLQHNFRSCFCLSTRARLLLMHSSCSRLTQSFLASKKFNLFRFHELVPSHIDVVILLFVTLLRFVSPHRSS